MRYLVIRDDAGPDELRAAVVELRRRQRSVVIPSTRDELDKDINEALDMLARAE